MKHDLHVSTAEAWEMGERRPTQEQSLALWEKSKVSGASGKVARDRLCYIYRPLVEAVVLRGFAKRNSPLFDDLVQAGYVGLLEGIDHYDPTTGVIFSSYCWSRVDWQLKAAHTQMMNVVSFSARDGKLRRKAFAVRNRLHTQLGR